MKAIHYLSILVIAAMFASCSKGDTGAQGPAGTNGVANISTQEYTVNSWPNETDYTYYVTFSESDITDQDNDAVEVYWATPSVTGWLALPATGIYNAGDELSYGFADNSITFNYYTGGSSSPNLPPSEYNTIYFKVTVIPPSIQVKYPGTNWKNASEVANIPEVHDALFGHK